MLGICRGDKISNNDPAPCRMLHSALGTCTVNSFSAEPMKTPQALPGRSRTFTSQMRKPRLRGQGGLPDVLSRTLPLTQWPSTISKAPSSVPEEEVSLNVTFQPNGLGSHFTFPERHSMLSITNNNQQRLHYYCYSWTSENYEHPQKWQDTC